MKDTENIALFDMDGVLCDYDKSMKRNLEKISDPNSTPPKINRGENPLYIKNRIELIRNQQGWWSNLEIYQPGFDILEVAMNLGFKINILTKASRDALNSYTEKVLWLKNNMPNFEEISITHAENKGSVYGKVLVEDYPKNIDKWLKWRKNGLVIMPDQSWNKNYENPQVVSYNGKNLEEIREKMKKARDRKARQSF